MNRLKRIVIGILLCAALACPALAEHTVQEVRDAYSAITRTDQLYETKADLKKMQPAALTPDAEASMLEYVRFMRWLAGVDEPLELREQYTRLAQDGALLLAVADMPAHALPQPEKFPDALYESASAGIGGSNLASINWMDTDVLFAAIEHFQRDEGGYNRFALGHRRWLLSPALQHTGFGMANAESGMTYVTMYVHDFTAEKVGHWEHIAWPAAGAFPAEYMYGATPWSVTFNERIYPAEQPVMKITAECEQTGERFVMDRQAQEDAADAYWINADRYGIGWSLIFRPASAQEFEQNQVWNIRIEDIMRVDGSLTTIEYDVRMMALEPIPVRLIEMESTQMNLQPGEETVLHADVVPHWADDVSLHWSSTDESVAVVDDGGNVQAIGVGTCEIIAQGADNQSATCTITVK